LLTRTERLKPKTEKPDAATEGAAIRGDMIAVIRRFVLFSESIFDAAKSIALRICAGAISDGRPYRVNVTELSTSQNRTYGSFGTIRTIRIRTVC